MQSGRLLRAAQEFTTAYHDDPALVAEGQGWSRLIRLRADDSAAAVAFHVIDGRVAAVTAGDAAQRAADIELRAPEELLLAVLERRARPAELYLFGELVVQGAEADLLRLDYIAARLERP